MLLEVVRELWPVVAALYVLDGLHLVRRGHWLFAAWTFGGFHRLGPGLKLAGMLPTDRLASAHRLLLVETPRGLAVVPAREKSGVERWELESRTHLAWEDLAPTGHAAIAREGQELRLGSAVVALPSPAHAEHWQRAVTALAASPAEARRRAIRQAVAERFDLARLRERRALVEMWARRVERLALPLFLVTLVVLPLVAYGPLVAYWPLGRRVPIAAVLVALLVLHAGCVATVAIAARRLARAGVAGTRGLVLPLLLSPPTAIQASATFGTHLYPDFDALALAAELLPRAAFQPLVRGELYLLDLASARATDADWRWALGERQRALLHLLAALGLAEEEARAAPARGDATAVAFCPVCGGEYGDADRDCSECGVPIQRFVERVL